MLCDGAGFGFSYERGISLPAPLTKGTIHPSEENEFMSTVSAEPAPTFPADVAAFAARQEVVDYLLPVWQMTQIVFPMAQRMTVRLEADPEIPNERHITFEVHARELDVSRYVELHWQWSRELFQICPPTHVCLFSLDLEMSDA